MSADGEVIVVGAGIAGLAAARELLLNGASVSVLDKARGVGGRMATRRIGDATFDHGAQFFTVRGADFRTTIDTALDLGIVDVWCRGFGADDGHPRYFCPGGMTGLAKWLASQVTELGGRIETDRPVDSVSVGSSGWSVATAGAPIDARAVVLTCPIPQSLVLLDRGGTGHAGLAPLRSLGYKSVLAVLAVLDGPSGVPDPGGVQFEETDLFTFVADNAKKGISERPALTLHTNGETSARRWDEDRAAVLDDLLSEAAVWFGSADVVDAQIHGWRYAAPLEPRVENHLVVATDPGPLLMAGEAFGGPKVEGSFVSGLAAARAVVAETSAPPRS